MPRFFNTTLIRIFILSAAIFCYSLAQSQSSGPSAVALGSTYTYSYYDGTLVDGTWTVNGGTINNTWMYSRVNYASITFTSIGSHEVDFVDNYTGDILFSRIVVVNNCSGTTVTTPTSSGTSRCGAGTVTLTASTPGTGYGLRWYTYNATKQAYLCVNSGTTNTSYTTASLSTTTNYYVSRFNTSTGCESTKVTDTVRINIAAASAPAQTICSGGPTNIVITNPNGGKTTFNWTVAYNNASCPACNGSTSGSGSPIKQTLNASSLTANGTATYTITPTISGCPAGSPINVTATVTSSMAGTVTPSKLELYAPVGTYSFTASGYTTVSGSSILWQQSLDGMTNWTTALSVPYNTMATYSYSSITASTYYRLRLTNGICTTYSPIVPVIVSQPPIVKSNVNNIAINGAPITLHVSTNAGAKYYSYQWAKAGIDIAGATDSTCVVKEAASYSVRVTTSTTSPSYTSVFNVYMTGLQPDNTSNSVITTTIRKKGVSSSTNLYTSLYQKDYAQSIQYLDGLSRPLQTVALGQSPQLKDVVQPYSYDTLVPTNYLPYVGNTRSGTLRATALSNGTYTNSDQYLFYQQSNTKIANSTAPYAKTVYENSPVGRVLEQGSVGTDWQPGTHTVKPVFHTNNATFKVRTWSTNGPTGYYAANLLAVSRVTDENGNPVMTYTDKQGNTILKRVKTSSMTDTTTWLETYYVYDTRGNLALQVPPKVSAMLNSNTAWSTTLRDTWCFVYKYTSRNQLEQKQVPGSLLPTYYVYDTLGRLVLTQDGNLRVSKQWAFVKYDIKGRVVMSGIYTNTVKTSLHDVKALVKSQYADPALPWYENRGTTLHGYTNQSFPTTNGDGTAFTSTQILSVNYYDNYDFDFNGSADWWYKKQNISGEGKQGNSFGLATGSKRLVMDGTGSKWLKSYVFYDRFGRVIQTRSNNHLMAAIDNTIIDNLGTIVYDFEGKVLQAKTYHNAGGTNQYTILQTNSYDSAGRLVQVSHGINGAAPVTVAKYEYNELGQVVDKKLHNTGSNFLQSVDYRYHIRGWLSSINNAQLVNDTNVTNDDSNDFFGIELLYNTTQAGLNDQSGDKVYYNGNVSAIKWKNGGVTSGMADQRSYKYMYDNSDKLKSATFQANTGSAWTKEINTLDENMSYDHNGNILNLQRNQNTRLVDGTNNATLSDNLTYTYTVGNKLSNVSDAGSSTSGFIDVANASTVKEYSYDTLGNLTADKNKGISSITYNVLGKAQQISFTNGNQVVYTYDAAGTKLTMTSTVSGQPPVTTNYIGGFVYNTNAGTSTLNFFSSPEGRVVKNGSGGFDYQYAIADHQGNTRVIFTSATPLTETRTATYEGLDDVQYYKSYPTTTTNFGTVNDHTPSGSNAQLLYAGKVGLSKSYHVYPGDKVHIDAWGMYRNLSQSGSNLSGFATTLVQAFQLSVPASGETGTASSGLYSFGGWEANGWGDGSPDNTDVRAFVNIIMFDKNFKYLDAAYAQLTATSAGVYVSMSQEYIAKEEGYAYLYISNENQKMVDVYFDDVTMTYTQGNIIQSNEYYPFGLQTANSWTRTDATSNNFLANGGTELNTTSALYDLQYRNYDPSLGRFHQVDPMADIYGSKSVYHYANNNPVSITDRSGAVYDPYGDWESYNYHPRGVQDGPGGGGQRGTPNENNPFAGWHGSMGGDTFMYGDIFNHFSNSTGWSGTYSPNSYWTVAGAGGALSFNNGNYYWSPSAGSASTSESQSQSQSGMRQLVVSGSYNFLGFGKYAEMIYGGVYGEQYSAYELDENGNMYVPYTNELIAQSSGEETSSSSNWFMSHYYYEVKGDVSVGAQATLEIVDGALVPGPYSNMGGVAINAKPFAYTLAGYKHTSDEGGRVITSRDVNYNSGIGISVDGFAGEYNYESMNGRGEHSIKGSMLSGMLGFEINFTKEQIFIGVMPSASWTFIGGISAGGKSGLMFNYRK